MGLQGTRLRNFGGTGLLLGVLAASPAIAQNNYDIGTGGTATIAGTVNGSVVVNPNQALLQVTVNFGEVSPVNVNQFVRVVVPVIVRSDAAYQVAAFVNGSNFGTTGDALKLSDIGMGIINVRSLRDSRICPNTPHTVQPPFNTDPQLNFTNAPRVTYPGNVGLVTASRVVLTGPILSDKKVNLPGGNLPGGQRDNGWAFDLVLVLAPQFFTPSTSTATLTLTIGPGPAQACQ